MHTQDSYRIDPTTTKQTTSRPSPSSHDKISYYEQPVMSSERLSSSPTHNQKKRQKSPLGLDLFFSNLAFPRFYFLFRFNSMPDSVQWRSPTSSTARIWLPDSRVSVSPSIWLPTEGKFRVNDRYKDNDMFFFNVVHLSMISRTRNRGCDRARSS